MVNAEEQDSGLDRHSRPREVVPVTGRRLSRHSAPHVANSLADWKAQFEEAVLRTPALRHLSLYTSAIYDFDVDAFDGEPDAPNRDEVRLAGRQLTFQLGRLNPQLRELATGELIRTVIEAASGIIVCDSVVPGVYVVGLARADPSADRVVADLVTAMRQTLSRGSQNPGGWQSDDEPTPDIDADLSAKIHAEGEAGSAALAAASAALSPSDLHYVAHMDNGSIRFAVDLFEHPLLHVLHHVLDPHGRRQRYRGITEGSCKLVAELTRIVRTPIGRPVSRLVLDVEQGAIYVYRLAPGNYLIGVTLIQNAVHATDRKMRHLVDEHLRPMGRSGPGEHSSHPDNPVQDR